MSARADGERVRIKHAISRMRTILSQVESTLDVDAPPGPDVGQAVAHAGVDIACHIARLEAYMRVDNGVDNDVFMCRYCGRMVDFLKPYHSDERGLWHWECGAGR